MKQFICDQCGKGFEPFNLSYRNKAIYVCPAVGRHYCSQICMLENAFPVSRDDLSLSEDRRIKLETVTKL